MWGRVLMVPRCGYRFVVVSVWRCGIRLALRDAGASRIIIQRRARPARSASSTRRPRRVAPGRRKSIMA